MVSLLRSDVNVVACYFTNIPLRWSGNKSENRLVTNVTHLWSDDSIDCHVIRSLFAPAEQNVGSKGALEKTNHRSVGRACRQAGAKPFFQKH